MDMIERVAEAIWSQHTGQTEFAVDTYDHGEAERQWWRNVARVAIGAMRETPDAVVRINGSANWPKMIDAILAAALVTTPSKL